MAHGDRAEFHAAGSKSGPIESSLHHEDKSRKVTQRESCNLNGWNRLEVAEGQFKQADS